MLLSSCDKENSQSSFFILHYFCSLRRFSKLDYEMIYVLALAFVEGGALCTDNHYFCCVLSLCPAEEQIVLWR